MNCLWKVGEPPGNVEASERRELTEGTQPVCNKASGLSDLAGRKRITVGLVGSTGLGQHHSSGDSTVHQLDAQGAFPCTGCSEQVPAG